MHDRDMYDHGYMVKTTVYLNEEVKRALAGMARANRCSEADLIRAAVDRFIELEQAPRPALPLFSSGDPSLAERSDEAPRGFGE